ncbi:MAG: hypothetical protein AABZ33_06910 [Chloroflexota bacterium]
MTTTAIDQSMSHTENPNATAVPERLDSPGQGPVADQAARVDGLRSDFDQAEERSEAARQAYVDGVQSGVEPDELRTLRRAWDTARSARNAIESLVMIQDASIPAIEG